MFVLNGWDSVKERLDGLLPSGSLRARFARGAFWAVAGMVIAQGLALAASVLVARIFDSRSLYGELGMIRNTVIMLGIFAGMGLGLTTNRHVAEFRDSDPARAGRVIAMSHAVATASAALMSLAVILLAPWLASWTLNAPQLAGALRVGAVILFFEALNGVQLSTLAGFEAFKWTAFLSLVRGLATFPLMAGGAWLGKPHGDDWALLGVIWGLAAATALGWLVNRIVLRRLMRSRLAEAAEVSLAEARRELPLLWTFSLPVLFINVLSVFAPWAAAAILVRKTGAVPGYDALGVFNAANQWQYPVTLLSTQVAVVLLPMLASFPSDADGRRRSDRAVEAAHFVVVIAVLPLAALLSCLAGWVMSFYGPQFADAVGVFWAAIFVAGLKSAGTILGTILLARGAIWASFFINFGWALALLALVLAWVRGAGNYADAYSLAYLAATLAALLFCVLRRYCPWSFAVNILFLVACIAVVTYGMGFAGSIRVRLLLVAGACVVAGVAALKAWRELKSGIPAPSPGA